VRFSNLPSMHALGDAATTLGLLFAAVGLGCFLGPLVSNTLTPPRFALPPAAQCLSQQCMQSPGHGMQRCARM
jgi:hypothetical protein